MEASPQPPQQQLQHGTSARRRLEKLRTHFAHDVDRGDVLAASECATKDESTLYDVIVVGAGICGSSTAEHLSTKRGLKVLLLEQFPQHPHKQGSSHGESRIIRLAYADDLYIKLGRLSYELWADVERRSGTKLIERTGGVDFGDEGCIAELEAAFKKSGVPYEVLSHDEAKKRFPQFNFRRDHKIIFQPDGGVVLADRAIDALNTLALKSGAKIIRGERMKSFSVEYLPTQPSPKTEARVNVVTHSGKTFQGKKIVLSLGAWTKQALIDNGLSCFGDDTFATERARQVGVISALKVTQEQVVYFPVKAAKQHINHSSSQPGAMPVWIYHIPEGEFYGIPIVEGAPGIKVGSHRQGPTLVSPDKRFESNSDYLKKRRLAIADFVNQIFPGVQADTKNDTNQAVECLYTNTPDNDFVIDAHPQHPNAVVVATPCSGHGFKFGSAYGVLIASLIFGEKCDLDMNRFSMTRRVDLPDGWAEPTGDEKSFLTSHPSSKW